MLIMIAVLRTALAFQVGGIVYNRSSSNYGCTAERRHCAMQCSIVRLFINDVQCSIAAPCGLQHHRHFAVLYLTSRYMEE